MTDIQIFIMILLIHFLADFGLQTHEQSQNKSSSNKWLFYHVGVYTLIWGVAFFFLPIKDIFLTFWGWFLFCILIGVPHFITDYITSRVGKPFWEKGDLHNGFVVIGFDQVVHYLCLLYVFTKTAFLK